MRVPVLRFDNRVRGRYFCLCWPLTVKRSEEWFNSFLQKLFAPPKEGTLRHIWYDGLRWRWKSGIPGTVEVCDFESENWKKTTRKQQRQIANAFDPKVRKYLKHKLRQEDAMISSLTW
jgi:hypothetical protein